jgi:uncharacterized membrane protein
MMLRATIVSLAVALLALAGTRAAEATTVAVKLCNHYRSRADFALAYQQGGIWISTGWWAIPTGKCTTAPAVIPADTVYLTYVFPAEQQGLINTTHRFAVNTNIDHSFRITNADRHQPNTAMFFFMPSPTYVGGTSFHATYTMLQDGSSIQWGQ